MELFLPDQIVLNEASSAMLADVEETARRVHEYRPLPAEVTKRILDDLLGERVYASNAIEGNTLDLRETVTVLKTGRILDNRRREATEARNLGEAVNAVSGLVPLGAAAQTAERLLEIHRLILHETPDEYWGGRFREQGVIIEGAKYQPPDHTLVPTLVDRVMEHLRHRPEGLSPLLLACWAHWSLARIHPFEDGNGRISRLWQDLILFQADLTAAIIRPEERREYLDALTAADEGDFNRLFQITAQRFLTTFDRYLTVIAQDKELDAFAKEIAGEADTRVDQKPQLSYQRWARQMEQLRWEFKVCASRVAEAADNIRIAMHRFPMMTQEKWLNIYRELSPEMPLFFTLTVAVSGNKALYFFLFRKHEWIPSAPEQAQHCAPVSLVVSEDDGTGMPKHLDLMDESRLALREIFVVDDGFAVRRYESAASEMRYELKTAPMQIAQDFIREVVFHRLT